MDKEAAKVSFWAYDIFGYLLPGLLLLAGLTVSNKWMASYLGNHWNSQNYADYAIILGIAYIFGHVISGLSSFLLERLFLRHVLGYPTQQMFKEKDDTPKYVKIFFPGYFRPYSQPFRDAVRKKVRKKFTLGVTDDHDLFWLSWSYICAHHPVAYRRATHFLELYGFSRNMAMSFLLLVPSTWLPTWTDTMNGYLWSAGAFSCAWILFVNYTKLLRRLNDETYRAFVVAE